MVPEEMNISFEDATGPVIRDGLFSNAERSDKSEEVKALVERMAANRVACGQ